MAFLMFLVLLFSFILADEKSIRESPVKTPPENPTIKTTNDNCEYRIETSVVSSLIDDDDYDFELVQRTDNSEKFPNKTMGCHEKKHKKNSNLTKFKNTLNLRSKLRKSNKKSFNTSKIKTLSSKIKADKKIPQTLKPETTLSLTNDSQALAENTSNKNTNPASSLTLSTTVLEADKINIFTFLSSLANNDGFEQYVCGLCSYICYHLPSLKSHMWTHVKNIKFDYSVNTSIINAALDYENKLNRKLNSIKKNKILDQTLRNSEKTDTVSSESNMFLERQFLGALELINYPQTAQKLSNICNSLPMVSFRCSRCGFETIDLSLLRLHKREHYLIPSQVTDIHINNNNREILAISN